MSKSDTKNPGKAVSPSAPDHLRSLREAARVWGINRNTLNDLLNRGEIAYVRPGKERRIPDSSMKAWIERSLVGKET